MSAKYSIKSDPEINQFTILPAADLTVYASKAAPGAVSITMTYNGVVQAGARFSREQIAGLIQEFAGLIEEDAYCLAYEQGFAAGEVEGARLSYGNGYDEGNSDGWEEGYQLGFEHGVEAGQGEGL